MRKIGITGSIGSGKTTVARVFMHLGIPVYSADERAKQLMTEDPELVAGIRNLFGDEAYLKDGSLNRSYISSNAFHNKHLLTQLNALVHPAVIRDFDLWCGQQKSAYVLKEAALMFESESYKQLDEVITVTAPEQLRIKRTMQRDGMKEAEVRQRMQFQMSEEEKAKRSKHIIRNDEETLVIPQVLDIHQQLMQE